MKNIDIIEVRPESVMQETLFCVKNTKSDAFKLKQAWFNERFKEGLCIKILKNDVGKPLAFIEYVPIEYAWRPVRATNLLFIHCMYVYANKDKRLGLGSQLIQHCETEALNKGMCGVAVMSSKGSWMADKRLFEKNGFTQVDQFGRFELLVKKFDFLCPDPELIDWTANWKDYQGWHLVYADQCPWHDKSVQAIKKVADELGFHIEIKKITTSKEAQLAPSGFGSFSLLRDGKLIEDHYLSETRFRNIVKKEMHI
jgi:L-amino acid N-acyltransferase YncA